MLPPQRHAAWHHSPYLIAAHRICGSHRGSPTADTSAEVRHRNRFRRDAVGALMAIHDLGLDPIVRLFRIFGDLVALGREFSLNAGERDVLILRDVS